MNDVEIKFLDSFVESAIETLEIMAMMELSVGRVSPVDAFEQSLGYTASMQLCGDSEGLMIVSFSCELGRAIVAGMLGEDAEKVDEESLVDGVGEVANMIAGGARTKLSRTGYPFRLAMPEVTKENERNLTPGARPTGFRVDCTCLGHPFVIWLWSAKLADS